MAQEKSMIPEPFGLADIYDHGYSSQKKDFKDLHHVVRNAKKIAKNLSCQSPHLFIFRHILSQNGPQTRLYFLGIPNCDSKKKEYTLMYTDVFHDQIDADLSSQSLLNSFSVTSKDISKEEELLRERKRLRSFGISSYDFDETSGIFVFPASSTIYKCIDCIENGNLSKQSLPFNELIYDACEEARLDPKICPSNSNLCSFIAGNDIWVSSNSHARRLTFAHEGYGSSDAPISAGVPSFVIQEEFDRFSGYWWQPKYTKCDTTTNYIYRILYEEVDDSNVEILNIFPASSESNRVDEYRYPRAGTSNSISAMKMIEFQITESEEIVYVKRKSLPETLYTLFPTLEYIPRAGWTPDGQYVYMVLLDRKQQHMQIVLFSLDSFINDQEFDNSMEVNMSDDVRYQIIYEETSDIWINMTHILHFFPQNDSSMFQFITSSEKDGFCHLYFMKVQSHFHSHNLTFLREFENNSSIMTIQNTQITSGSWQICDKEIWVDHDRGLVYFIGLKDSALETHLYVTSFRGKGEIIRLTQLGYSHTVYMDKKCSMFTSIYSNLTESPCCKVYQIQHADNYIQARCLGTLQKSADIGDEYHPPEIFSFDSNNGFTMHGMYLKPHNLVPGEKYPTILYVYGGPHIQLVNNSFKNMRFMRLHTLASLQYAVVMVDSRGSSFRGIKFESYLQHKMGQVEIIDQIEGLQWLASNVDFIDLNRVAIHGWSYGGYLSLMGLCQRPDVFKVAIAGAPVTSWNLYDTGYTERYMDLPENNESGYKSASVLSHVNSFPNESNRLLIVHGLIDENVHFYHTSQLINELIKHCKPYQLQIYPNERHGIRNSDSCEHYETMVLNFLQQNL